MLHRKAIGPWQRCYSRAWYNRPKRGTISQSAFGEIDRGISFRLFSGFFHISAIRQPCPARTLQELRDYLLNGHPRIDPKKAEDQRYVGQQGEAAWLLERLFAWNQMCPPVGTKYAANESEHYFEGFVSYWTKKLCQAHIVLPFRSNKCLSEAWQLDGPDPSGFLRDSKPAQCPADMRDNDSDTLDRIAHDCLIAIQSPLRMSSGFHQLLPLIVQTGLMNPQEILAIENPEVHLHPSLQIAIAEFLLHQANSGKSFLVETHSDLIVSRVILEMLQERIAIGQEKIRIYFSHLKPRDTTCAQSLITQIRVDDDLRINWPPGFLDDHVRLSSKLFDVLYGIGGPESSGGAEP